MAALGSARVRSEGESLVLTLALDEADVAPGPIQVHLALHDDVEVTWYATFGCARKDDVWEGQVGSQRPGQRRLLELTSLQDAAGIAIEPRGVRLFLEPSGSGTWDTGAPAEAERVRLERARETRFGVPLTHPDATPGDPIFAVVMLADNLLLTTHQRVPGIEVGPILETTLGTDVPEVLNAVIKQLGFGSVLDAEQWMNQMRQRRPAVVVHIPKVRASDGRAAHEVSRDTARQLLDLLALRRGAAPQLLGGVVGRPDGRGVLQYAGFWVEGSNYAGNLAGGALSGEGQHGLLLHWDGLSVDPRARLWLSLHANAIADGRWDYRLFRYFNRLEGIAAEVVPSGGVVRDDQGNPRMRTSRDPYTTDHARGKVYELLRLVATRMQEAETNFTTRRADGAPVGLWDEVGVWLPIRNAVAHRGSWALPQGQSRRPGEAVAESEVKARAHDGTFTGGIWAMERTMGSAVESTLYAALLGRL